MIVYREFSSIEKDLGYPLKTLYGLSNRLEKHYHKCTFRRAMAVNVSSPFPI